MSPKSTKTELVKHGHRTAESTETRDLRLTCCEAIFGCVVLAASKIELRRNVTVLKVLDLVDKDPKKTFVSVVTINSRSIYSLLCNKTHSSIVYVDPPPQIVLGLNCADIDPSTDWTRSCIPRANVCKETSVFKL